MIYGINLDRTKEFKLEKKLELERAKSIQSAKLASLGEMSAGIAHEINNPLAIIVGSLSLMSKISHEPDKLKNKLETLEKAAQRISKIVTGLRKFSRSSENKVRKLIPLRNIIAETLILTEAKSKQFSTPVIVECATDSLVYCDEIEIEQILVNLVNNGIDAVEKQSERWVRVNAFDDGQTIVMQIRDSGKGIPPEIQTKLFQPFFTTKPIGKGTGLGLSIVKGILEDHKAMINIINSDPNTCFEIRFQMTESEQESKVAAA